MSRRKDASAAYSQYQQKRRLIALERQKAARQEKVQHIRSLAQAALQDDRQAQDYASMLEDAPGQQHPAGSRYDATAEASTSNESAGGAAQLYGLDGVDPSKLSGASLRSYFAKQLMTPEWMTDIPPDLASSWLVMPRPEGKRCLVISSGGCTVSRSRTGALLHRFSSHLPGGSPDTNNGTFCVLDCIFQEHSLPVLPHEQHQQQQHQQQQQQIQVHVAEGQASMDEDQPLPSSSGTGAGSSPGISSSRSGSRGSSRGGGSSSGAGSGTRGYASAADGTFYIQDVLAWRSYSVVDCAADFRLFWLASKVAEDQVEMLPATTTSAATAAAADHPCRFKLLPYWPATPDGLQAAATAGTTSAATPPAAAAAAGNAAAAAAAGVTGPSQQQQHPPVSLPFTQDGCYLRHSQGHYCLGESSTPLALLWKDESCSRYLLDTDACGVVPDHQQVVLSYQGPDSRGVATGDLPPVVLGRLPADFITRMGSSLSRSGRLLRFSIREGGIIFNPADGSPTGADLAYEGPANQRRGRPDQLSKIVFQWQARKRPLQLQELVAAAAAQVALDDAADGGSTGGGGGDDAPSGSSALLVGNSEEGSMQLDQNGC